MSVFLSTPSARRATVQFVHLNGLQLISIHALREEGDAAPPAPPAPLPYFYPRPPRGGRLQVPRRKWLRRYFYPRPPRGGRRCRCPSWRPSWTFLSTPSARRATSVFSTAHTSQGFLSTPSARRATKAQAARNLAAAFLSTPSARRATAKTETKSLFSNKLYNILHEFRRALIYNGSKNYPNHAKRLENPVRRCRKDAEDSPFAPGRKTQNNSRPSCSKGG